MQFAYKGITFDGVTKRDFEHLRSAVDFVFDNNVTGIEVDITKLKLESSDGKRLNATIEVFGDDDTTENDIYVVTLVRRKHNEKDGSMWATLVHELTHYKQMISGRLAQGIDNTAMPMEEYLSGWQEVEAHQQQFAYRRATEGLVPADSYFITEYARLGIVI